MNIVAGIVLALVGLGLMSMLLSVAITSSLEAGVELWTGRQLRVASSYLRPVVDWLATSSAILYYVRLATIVAIGLVGGGLLIIAGVQMMLGR